MRGLATWQEVPDSRVCDTILDSSTESVYMSRTGQGEAGQGMAGQSQHPGSTLSPLQHKLSSHYNHLSCATKILKPMDASVSHLDLDCSQASHRPTWKVICGGASYLQCSMRYQLGALHVPSHQLILQQQAQGIALQVLQPYHHQQIVQQARAGGWLPYHPVLDCPEDWHLHSRTGQLEKGCAESLWQKVCWVTLHCDVAGVWCSRP